jgi:hypothetical protein
MLRTARLRVHNVADAKAAARNDGEPWRARCIELDAPLWDLPSICCCPHLSMKVISSRSLHLRKR